MEPKLAVATERAFKEALEESVQSSSIEGLMADRVREQIQGRVMQVVGVGPVRFVSYAEWEDGRSHVVWETTGAPSNRGASRVGEVPAVFEVCLVVRYIYRTLDRKSADNV